jgi:hypothetical protein
MIRMSGGTNWWTILILFVLPLTLGSAAFLFASKFRRKGARLTIRVVGSAFLLALLVSVVEIAPYLWALHLEAKWRPANPKTKAQLESFLSLYAKREIQTSQSMWGGEHQLLPGERMIQYRLLYSAPLDVVYTRSNTIVAIYTSYE